MANPTNSKKELTSAEINERGNNYLKLFNREQKTLKINALGVDELVAGKGFKFILSREGINQDMWIVHSTHYYEKDSHTMELEVYI